MRLTIRLLPVAASVLMLVGCGGGSSSPNIVALGNDLPVVYTVTDGHVEGAQAFCMVDSSKNYDTSPNFKAKDLSNKDGKFSFDPACSSSTLAFGGKNTDTGLPFKGLLKAPANATVLTPLTTLIVAGMTEQQVMDALQLPAGNKLLTSDPASTVSGSPQYPELMQKTLAVQQLLMKTAEVLASLGGVNIGSTAASDATIFNGIYQSAVASMAGVLKAGSVAAVQDNKFSAAFVNQLVQSSVQEAGRTYAQVQTGVNAVGASNLAQAVATGLASQANALLAADPVKELLEVTKRVQANQAIATTVVDAVKNGTLTTNAATVAAVQSAVEQVAISQAPGNYLNLANDISFDTGAGTPTTYTLSQFQTSPGIKVQWPMTNAAAIGFKLSYGEAFSLTPGQVTSAALEIAQVQPVGSIVVKAYVDNVSISRSNDDLKVTVLDTAFAPVYISGVQLGTATIEQFMGSFAPSVVGLNNTLSLASGAVNRLQLGSVINGVLASAGDVSGLTGKTYKVTLVVSNLAMRANGLALPNATISVPTKSGIVPISGSSLTGYITLAP